MSFLFSRYVLTMRLPCPCILNSVLGASRKHSRVNLGITSFWKLFSFQMWRSPFHICASLNICCSLKLSLCSSNPSFDSLHFISARRPPIRGKVQKWWKATGHCSLCICICICKCVIFFICVFKVHRWWKATTVTVYSLQRSESAKGYVFVQLRYE